VASAKTQPRPKATSVARTKPKPKAKAKVRRRRSPVPRVLAAAALILACFLYYRPVQSYVHTRSQVRERQAEVSVLQARKASLERQLKAGASDAALLRQARRLGYVRPGEKLYIVTGINRWRKAHARSASH
jgi:cell division protein FtsB